MCQCVVYAEIPHNPETMVGEVCCSAFTRRYDIACLVFLETEESSSLYITFKSTSSWLTTEKHFTYVEHSRILGNTQPQQSDRKLKDGEWSENHQIR